MNQFSMAETLHRLIKQAIDSGAAGSIEEAHELFSRYRLTIEIDASADPVQHATLLTATTLARRVFLGGVTVHGALDVPCLSPMLPGCSLADAVVSLGGSVGRRRVPSGDPTVVIGARQERREGFCVRAVAAGWRGGIVPAHSDLEPAAGSAMPLAGMLAAALAINEAFIHVSSGVPAAGRRTLGLSLWDPQATIDWLAPAPDEPALRYLPSRLWLVGLGHLGQAYLWGLGLLPYASPESLRLFLQDVDVITPSTESTSVLTDASSIGTQKTRAMAAWASTRGFDSCILERLFQADFKRQAGEPAIALCGLDNGAGRRALDQVGFDLVVEAGLGRGHRDFRTMRLHTLPGPRPSAEMWKSASVRESPVEQSAYNQLLTEGVLDRCGMTVLAGKAVGAPFVGSIAGALALAEVLRLLHGGPLHQVIDVDLQSLDQRVAVRHSTNFSTLNPGFALAL
jgi:hypothetical protein